MRLEGLGRDLAIAVCMYIWRRLLAEHGELGYGPRLGLAFMAWYGPWSQWTCRQVGFAPSLCSIHAHVMACRRSLLAPLGRPRRSALLVSMSWTPRSDGVSCPVPVVLSSFCRQSFSPSRGSVGVFPLWETSFEVERNPFRSAEFHPAGVVIG